jgi:hypothetical protein
MAPLLCSLLLSACASSIMHTSEDHQNFSITPDSLSQDGIAFITPSTITGREQDRQSLALTFAEVFRETRPDARIVTLPETIAALNRSGLRHDYEAMLNNYAKTGIFDPDSLRKVGDATGARYLAQLKLASFTQDTDTRFNLLGYRLLETKRASIRIFLQVWDSETGNIAWEGYQEMSFSNDTYSEEGVTFRGIAREIAADMIAMIYGHSQDAENETQ